MKQAALFAKEHEGKSSVVSGSQPQQNVVIRRIPDLDLYRDQKSRRSVTFPPSFGDYMAVRKRSEQYNQNKFWQSHLDPYWWKREKERAATVTAIFSTHHTPHNTQHTTNTAHAANTHTTTDSLANVERPILATILYSSCSSNARSYLAPTQDTITHRKKGVAGHTSVYGLERHTTTTMASLFFTFDTSFHPVPLLATSGRSWKTTSTRKWYPYTYK